MLTTQNIDPNDPLNQRFFLLRWAIRLWHWVLPPTQAHMDRESGKARWIRATVLITGCLAMMVIAAMYAKPMQDRYQEWQAEGLVKDAERYVDNGDVVSAVMTAKRAYSIAPEYEPGVRLNAQLLTRIGYAKEAVYFWEKLEKKGTASVVDLQGKVRALLRINKAGEARQVLQEIINGHPMDKDVMKLAEEVWGRQQMNTLFLDVLKNYAKDHPDDRDSQLRLYRMQLQSQDASDPAKAREGLWSVATEKTKYGLEALRTLGEMQSLDIAERKRLADLLEAHDEATGWDYTKALSLRVSLSPGDKEQLMDATTRRFAGKKGADLHPMVRWLVENREFGRVVGMLDLPSIKTRKEDQPLLLNYMSALTMLGRINELESLVNDKDVLLPKSTRDFYQAHLAMIKGADRDTLKRRLSAARVSALSDGQAEMLLNLGVYCTDKLNDFYDIALDCFRDVATTISSVRLERRAFEGWIRCARMAGDTESLGKASREANRRWPDDKTFIETRLYVDLLEGNGVEMALAQSERLLESSPTDSMRKLVNAFAYYRMGNLDSAVSALQNIDMRADGMGPGEAVIFAAIFNAAGMQRVAGGDAGLFQKNLNVILKPVPERARLLPEEGRLLRRVRHSMDMAAR